MGLNCISKPVQFSQSILSFYFNATVHVANTVRDTTVPWEETHIGLFLAIVAGFVNCNV